MSQIGRIKKLFEQYYNDTEYIIDDIIYKHSKYIFILESPHNKELKQRIPAAGLSGKSMSKFLGIQEDISLGNFAKKKTNEISIMNISKVPLDIENLKEPKYSELTKSLALVRTGFECYNKHDDQEVNEIEKIIQDDFKKRIEEFIESSQNAIFIICGRFAQNYFGLSTDKRRDSKKILYVPHPSRNQWNNSENDLNQLKDILHK